MIGQYVLAGIPLTIFTLMAIHIYRTDRGDEHPVPESLFSAIFVGGLTSLVSFILTLVSCILADTQCDWISESSPDDEKIEAILHLEGVSNVKLVSGTVPSIAKYTMMGM